MRIKNILSLCFVFIFAGWNYAQQTRVDSIKRVMSLVDDTTHIRLLVQLSEAYLAFSPKRALDPAGEARLLSSQTGNERLTAFCLDAMGKVNYKTGSYKDAIECYNESGSIYKKLGLENNYAEGLVSLSNIYNSQGNYTQALDRSLEAYRIFESKNNKTGMARALLVSGNVYRSNNKYDRALEDYEKAISFSREASNSSIEASCLISMSIVYSAQGDAQKEIDYLMRAKGIYERSGDLFALSKALNNIGTVHLEKEQYDFATDYFLQSLDMSKQIGDKRGQTLALTNLGYVNVSQNKNDKAIEYFNRALDLAKAIGAVDMEITIYEALSEAYAYKGEYERSLQYFKQVSALKDSLFDKDFTESIAEMQARYGVEKAESETRAQQKQKTLITWFAVLGGILLLAILFFVWNRAVTRKKVNLRLNQQKDEIELKNSELEQAKELIEHKNKDITDSILYASRIQGAILPEMEFNSTFKERGFVLYRPKDIVSGDFYWMEQTDTHILFAAVDCTGHGVPGAFVSIVCSNLLSQSVKEHGLVDPAQILNDVNIRLSQTLRQRKDESRMRDGMDIALCSIERKTNKLTYAGAFNPVWIFRGAEKIELLPDKFPVGHFIEERIQKFVSKEILLHVGDRIYVFSDGFSDQFGGPKGKKYKRSVFSSFLHRIQSESFLNHRYLLEQEHLQWKANHEQVDDVLVLGVEIEL
jgi:serine phosphatase RsbU (regulator of sigma subunit)/Tfp pilus assembly protein PilF